MVLHGGIAGACLQDRAAIKERKSGASMDEKGFRERIERMKDAVSGRTIATRIGLSGDRSRFYCPSCQADGGKTPDLAVYDNGFKCFKCGKTGDVIDLLVLSGMSKAEAIRASGNGSWLSRIDSEAGSSAASLLCSGETDGRAILGPWLVAGLRTENPCS